jgi:hypothetical protein
MPSGPAVFFWNASLTFSFFFSQLSSLPTPSIESAQTNVQLTNMRCLPSDILLIFNRYWGAISGVEKGPLVVIPAIICYIFELSVC